MSNKKAPRKKGGSKKHLRSKRPKDAASSLYAKGKITFEQYMKLSRKA